MLFETNSLHKAPLNHLTSNSITHQQQNTMKLLANGIYTYTHLHSITLQHHRLKHVRLFHVKP